MTHLSPLRYPGGKASLAGFLTKVIEINDLRGAVYFEPYAGGAGAALRLLKDGVVSEIFINDADERVSAFWQSALDESERFVERVLSVPLTIQEWFSQRAVCAHPNDHPRFDVGFAAFFMNRCNRSGVMTGAGPIGGLEQAGKWRLDVRFSREPLAERIFNLARLRNQIHVTNLDAINFLKTHLPNGNQRSRIFVYLDPPYVNKGQRLYLNAYQESDHAALARYLDRQRNLPWVMSYDDTALVRTLYSKQVISSLPIRYSLHEKRTTSELFITPSRMALPHTFELDGKDELFETTSKKYLNN